MASKTAELRELNDTELISRLAEAKEEHFNLTPRRWSERSGGQRSLPVVRG